MQPRLLTAACAALFAICSGACSLLQLDQVEPSDCTQQSDCDAANRAFGIDADTQCTAYRCDSIEGLCMLMPRDMDGDHAFASLCRDEMPDEELDCNDEDPERSWGERCDGIDNDCDARIDEGALKVSDPMILGEAGMPSYASYAPGPEGTTYLALGSGTGSANGWVLSEVEAQKSKLHYAACPSEGPDQSAVDETCRFSRLAMAASGQHLLFASVSTLGCAGGQVRVGISGTDEPFVVQLGRSGSASSRERSNIEFGVDIDADGEERGCTGASRTSAIRGADAPALAAIQDDDGRGHALALWLATPAGAQDGCAPFPALDIEAVALDVNESPAGAWLDAADDGIPQLIGRSSSRSAPSIAAVTGPQGPLGYLVAFAGDGGVSLAFARSPASREGLQVESLGRAVVDAHADRVALSQGGVTAVDGEMAQGFALAWRSGCGVEAPIRFARIALAAGGERVVLQSELSLQPAAQIVAGPTLVYASAGFAETETSGGWLVLWVEAGEHENRLLGARIAELDSAPMGVTELATGDIDLVFPRALTSSRLGYGFVRKGAEQDELMLGDATCTESETD